MDKKLFIIRNVVKYLDQGFNFTNIRLVCKTFDNFIMNEFLMNSINKNKPLLKTFIINFILYGVNVPFYDCSCCESEFYNIRNKNVECFYCNNKYCPSCVDFSIFKCDNCNNYCCCISSNSNTGVYTCDFCK